MNYKEFKIKVTKTKSGNHAASIFAPGNLIAVDVVIGTSKKQAIDMAKMSIESNIELGYA